MFDVGSVRLFLFFCFSKMPSSIFVLSTTTSSNYVLCLVPMVSEMCAFFCFFHVVHGSRELCHIQPSNLRLLYVSSMGKHGGVVSGHVLYDPGASLCHLQAVHTTWEVLRCKSEKILSGIPE